MVSPFFPFSVAALRQTFLFLSFTQDETPFLPAPLSFNLDHLENGTRRSAPLPPFFFFSSPASARCSPS